MEGSAMWGNVWPRFLKYFWPSNLFAGFNFISAEWQRGNIKERSLILLIFTPMLVCMLGLIFSFAGFVFAFISRLLGWFLLTAFFGGGGILLYEKLRENQSFSSSFSGRTVFYEEAARAENENPGKSSKRETGGEDSGKTSGQKKWFQEMRR
jgi:hypothetical protein